MSTGEKFLFAIPSEKCFFCGDSETVLTREHYIVCLNCLAAYTYMKVKEARCEHIVDGVPTIVHMPILSGLPDMEGRPFVIEIGRNQYCSSCFKGCIADGW